MQRRCICGNLLTKGLIVEMGCCLRRLHRTCVNDWREEAKIQKKHLYRTEINVEELNYQTLIIYCEPFNR